MGYIPRLRTQYDAIKSELQSELGLTNVMQIPKVEKVVVNIGQGDAVQNIKVLEGAMKDLETITGQKPVMTRARRVLQVSNFVKVCRSAVVLHYVASACTNF